MQAIGMRTLIPIIENVHDNERVSATFSHFVNGYNSTPLISGSIYIIYYLQGLYSD